MADLQATDRFTLLLGLVPYLNEKGEVPVTEIAEHFGIDEKTVRRVIDTLVVSGVPDGGYDPFLEMFNIDWDAYDDRGVVTLTESPYDPPQPRLSSREAATLIASLQYLAALPDRRGGASIDELIAKLSRGAAGAPTPIAVALPHHNDIYAALSDAIRDDRQVDFDYLSARGDRQRRRVDPLRLLSVDSTWYLKAWCHLRKGLRTFRLDQISDLTTTEQPRSDSASSVPMDDRLFDATGSLITATLRVTPGIESFLGEYLLGAGKGPEYSVGVEHFHGLKRLAATHAGQVEIVAPPAARQDTVDWAREALARYSTS